MTFELKHIAGKAVLFAMAAEAEYGPHLKSRIRPLMTGIGPVEASISLTRTLGGLEAADRLPHLIVSLGSAGSARLRQTEIYQVSSVAYRDMDASAFGFPKGETPFLGLPAAVDMPLHIPGLPGASLSTGANVVSGSEQYQAIDADMVDMETFAILRASQTFKVPLIGLRGISDGHEDVSHIGNWTEYLHIIDGKLSDAIDMLSDALENGTLRL